MLQNLLSSTRKLLKNVGTWFATSHDFVVDDEDFVDYSDKYYNDALEAERPSPNETYEQAQQRAERYDF